jgi:hypothetical protein
MGAFMNELLHIDRPGVTGWGLIGASNARTLRQRSLGLATAVKVDLSVLAGNGKVRR